MTIGAIRDAINAGRWAVNDLQGHTADEFTRRNVPAALAPHISKLTALEIKPRFTHEIEMRAAVLASLGRIVERWEGRRALLAMPPAVATLQ